MIGQFLSSVHIAEFARLARHGPNPWLLFDPSVLKESYNQRPFILRHRLSEHPLFQIDELFALCRRLPPSEVRVRVGKVPSDADFHSSLGQYNLGLTIQEVIEHVEEKQAYIAIYNPERDPDYKVAIEEFLGEIDQHIEALEAGLNWYSTYVFISARNSVTPYHMDREMNFLLQIRGTKTVKLWDPFDDEVMPAEVKDRLLAMPFGSRPPYRPGLDAKAMVFELQ